MRTTHHLAGIAAVIASPLLLTGASTSPATGPAAPTRCYVSGVYDSFAGHPSAYDLMASYLQNAQRNYADLRQRAPQLTEDPYFPGYLGQAQGEVEGFTALLEQTRTTPHPAFDKPLRAVDDEGQLIAEVTFSATIATDQGTYAVGEAVLPDDSRDPAHTCHPRGASSSHTSS